MPVFFFMNIARFIRLIDALLVALPRPNLSILISGEKGPTQSGIQKGGANYTAAKFPLLDYVTLCSVVDKSEMA